MTCPVLLSCLAVTNSEPTNAPQNYDRVCERSRKTRSYFFSFYNARERILGVCCRPWGQLTMATNQITPLYPCMFVNMSVCLSVCLCLSVCMYVCMYECNVMYVCDVMLCHIKSCNVMLCYIMYVCMSVCDVCMYVCMYVCR